MAAKRYDLRNEIEDALSSSMTGEEFKEIREKLGLSQSELAKVLGYGATVRISEFERKTNPRPIPLHVAMLMEAFRSGYRPPNWPK